MFFTGTTVAGDPAVPNEDWIAATSDLLVVLDGATVRTETGCQHGAAWYARKLGAAVIAGAANWSRLLPAVLASAIKEVADLHPGCDLTHSGTPSAGIAIVRLRDDVVEYLVLGDVTVVFDTNDGLRVASDQRISRTAITERREADKHTIGSTEKAAALLAMKYAELAARNRPGGYWIAATDPLAVEHALSGNVVVSSLRRLAILTDGAARALDMFQLYPSWLAVLDTLSNAGPQALIERVRETETSDPLGVRYPRNKVSDDATVMIAQVLVDTTRPEPPVIDEQRPLPPFEERLALASDLLDRMDKAYGDGMVQKVREERRKEAYLA